jgi:hypothetical protein
MRFRPQGLVPDRHRRAELAPETEPVTGPIPTAGAEQTVKARATWPSP